MALKQSTTLIDQFDEHITFNNAYHRIDRIEGGKSKMIICLALYKSQEEQKLLLNKTYQFVPSLSGNNFFAQAYEHLKTLPEFAGAVDC
jgi:hypothetical protein